MNVPCKIAQIQNGSLENLADGKRTLDDKHWLVGIHEGALGNRSTRANRNGTSKNKNTS